MIVYRHTKPCDGSKIREIVQKSKTLDLNSMYHYLILCTHFRKTCMVVEVEGELAGFVTAYNPPEQSDTLFVWQIAVAREFQGKGLGKKLLINALKNKALPPNTRLEATITPSNIQSFKLFRSVAAYFDAPFSFENVLFDQDLFGTEKHEQEILFKISPVTN